MKFDFVLYQTLILVCLFSISESIKPRRFFENLGRIHDAIHELSVGDLPENEAKLDREKPIDIEKPLDREKPLERPVNRPSRRHQERAGRTFSWHNNFNNRWPLFKPSSPSYEPPPSIQPPSLIQPSYGSPSFQPPSYGLPSFQPPSSIQPPYGLPSFQPISPPISPDASDQPLRLRLDPRLGANSPINLDEDGRPIERPFRRGPGFGSRRRGFGPRGRRRRPGPNRDRNYPNNDYLNYPDSFDRPNDNLYDTTSANDEDYYSDNGSNSSYNEEYDQYNNYQPSVSSPIPPPIRSNNNYHSSTVPPILAPVRSNNNYHSSTVPPILAPVRSNNNYHSSTAQPILAPVRSNDNHYSSTSSPIPAPNRLNNNNHQTSKPNTNHQTSKPNSNHPTSKPNNPNTNQPNRHSTYPPDSYSTGASNNYNSNQPDRYSSTGPLNNRHSYTTTTTTTETPRVTSRRPIITSTSESEWNDQSVIVKDKSLENAQKICGLRSAPRIVGGRDTKKTDWLWISALLKNDGTNYCGGTLITNYHILTAAHCLQGQLPKDMFVRLGEYDFSKNSGSTAEDHEVEYFIIHNYYDKFTHENDIAILKLKEPAQFTHFIRPVCLPKKRKDYVNEIGTVVGYGSSEYSSPKAGKLREVSVPIWKHDQCQEAYSANFTNGQMCAGFREGGSDSCQGDSGGPLMIQNNKLKWEIIGIVSFGIGCGRPGYPGVYTHVNRYLDWIVTNVI